MASSGGDASRGRDPKRTEIRKKIDDLRKITDELQKGVTEGSQQFKELLISAKDLRRIFDEVDNQLGERESLGVPGHVKDNVDWVKARVGLHEVYHATRSYIEQSAPPDKGMKVELDEVDDVDVELDEVDDVDVWGPFQDPTFKKRVLNQEPRRNCNKSKWSTIETPR
jgi:hypothetical protein